MAINSQWIPIISESISWINNQFGPSKKELQLKISDLERQVEFLAKGNSTLIENLNSIIQAILLKLNSSNEYIINSDYIYIGENIGNMKTEKDSASDYRHVDNTSQSRQKKEELDVSKIFDGVDEEISHTRLTNPNHKK